MGRMRCAPDLRQEITELLASGKVKPEVHIIDGIENLPQAQVNLFENSTTGKVVVRVA